MFGCDYYGGDVYGGACAPYMFVSVGVLGCGDNYEVYILARGGGALVAVFPWTSIDWARVLDDTSEATVVADPITCCPPELAAVKPWRHELAIYRDGSQVWVGPVVSNESPKGSYRIVARDLSAWWDHRLIHDDHSYAVATDLSVIFKDVSDDAMAPDPSPGLDVATSPCGVLTTAAILALQHLLAGTYLRDLSGTGIDWTAVGRSVLAGGLVVPVSSIGTFLDEHFAVLPTPQQDGTAQANSWIVRGAGGGAEGDDVFGAASDGAAAVLDGLLESLDTVSTLQDDTAADAAAASRVALTAAILGLQGGVLHPEAPFTIEQLVPGSTCVVALAETCLPAFGRFRLQQLAVSVQDGVGEQIVPTFQPLGTGP